MSGEDPGAAGGRADGQGRDLDERVGRLERILSLQMEQARLLKRIALEE